jgi:hypothetical protein
MQELNWRCEVEMWELREEPPLTEEADFFLASHVEKGSLAAMICRVMSQPEQDRGRFVLKLGDRVIYRREIVNLANRPDFPNWA